MNDPPEFADHEPDDDEDYYDDDCTYEGYDTGWWDQPDPGWN